MKIDIIAVGKVKESFYREAIAEFEKRPSIYCTLQIIEVADEKTPEGVSLALEEQIKAKEGERILKNLWDDAYVITLEIQGKRTDGVSYAKQLEHLYVCLCHVFVCNRHIRRLDCCAGGWVLRQESFSKGLFP